jgi:hypothetical protein
VRMNEDIVLPIGLFDIRKTAVLDDLFEKTHVPLHEKVTRINFMHLSHVIHYHRLHYHATSFDFIIYVTQKKCHVYVILSLYHLLDFDSLFVRWLHFKKFSI